MNLRVATITLNPAYDLIGRCEHFTRNAVNKVSTVSLNPAGKGINVARVLKSFGLDVTVGGFLGSENNTDFHTLFAQLNLINRFLLVTGRTRINVKVTEAADAVTELNFDGFTVTERQWQHFYHDSLAWLQDFDTVCISGSLPAGVAPASLTAWMRALRADGRRILFDSSHAAFSAGLKAQPWLIKPNRHELETWVGHPLGSHQAIVDAAQRVRQQGIENVIVSLGAEGALWVSAAGAWRACPPRCEIVSTVGAGDTMLAGLIYGTLRQQSLQDTLRMATAISALTVSQSAVGAVQQAQIAAMLTRVTLEQVAS